MRNEKIKREIRVAKIDPLPSQGNGTVARRQLNRLPVAGKSVKRVLPKPSSSVSVSLDGVHTTRLARASLQRIWQHVPVINHDRKPLMPTTPWRAERWIRSGKATPFWNKGIFCVRLNKLISGPKIQPIACGIDPGTKKEGLTVKSTAHTFINIQADAVWWVSKHVETRKMMRRNRRQRKTPCRAPRFNMGKDRNSFLAPSTKARWQWKLRLVNWLNKIFPISYFVIEDIKAKTKKGQRRWNVMFTQIEFGKNWFYSELKKIASVDRKTGFETFTIRNGLGLKKTKHKLSNKFEAHCIDSWVLANDYVGGHIRPDNTKMLFVVPLQFHRRKLHKLCPSKGGIRKRDGGTRSLGFKKGSLIKHPKYGLAYIGGYSNTNRITLHSLNTGERVSRDIRPEHCKFIAYLSWRTIR